MASTSLLFNWRNSVHLNFWVELFPLTHLHLCSDSAPLGIQTLMTWSASIGKISRSTHLSMVQMSMAHCMMRWGVDKSQAFDVVVHGMLFMPCSLCHFKLDAEHYMSVIYYEVMRSFRVRWNISQAIKRSREENNWDCDNW